MINLKFRWIALWTASFAITILCWSISPAQSIANQANLKLLLQQLIPQIEMTRVPPKLPGYMPLDRPFSPPSPPISALPVYTVLTPETDRYNIVVGYSPDCDGGNACRIGTIVGARRTDNTSIDQQYSNDLSAATRTSPEKAEFVSLANGHRGWFSPWVCGANCSDALLSWDDGNYRYLVSVKVGSRDQLVELANSAINNEGMS